MLEDHERAAMMPNEGNITWHYFIRSRFIGREMERAGRTSLTVDITTATLESHSHVAISGLLEYSTSSSLPVVFAFAGTVDLETREVRIDDGQSEYPARSYVGSFSENGRRLTLRLHVPGKTPSRQLHLVHEATLAELFTE